MRYRMVHWTQADRAPDRPNVLGYLFNHGGLNNQKMALIALLLSGIRHRQTINLPYIYNRDQQTDQEEVVRLGDVLNLTGILAFARQHDLEVLTDCPGGERGGWNYFGHFQQFLDGAGTRDALTTVLDAVASLKPLIGTHPDFLALRDFIFGALGIDTVVQLRIEADWKDHLQNHTDAALEDNGIGFMDIVAKIKRTFPDLRLAYITCDEGSMPVSKDTIRNFCREQFGIELFWKSDLLTPAFIAMLTPLDLSFIDFEIARYSPRFVGLSSSTFSNMLCLERFTATRKPVRGHYIYNHLGNVVVERRDNGFTCATHRAVAPTPAETLL